MHCHFLIAVNLPRGIAALLHFQKTRLVECARVDVDGMAIRGGSSGQALVVLDTLFHVLGSILVDVVVGSDGLLQLVIDHLAWTVRAWSAHEKHDTSTSVGV